MKKILLLLTALVAFFALSAQITQEEADSIVLERLSQEIQPHTIYAKEGIQTDMSITTANNEILELDYNCWVYYISYTDAGRYLIVNESNGNLLQVNTTSNAAPEDLVEWRVVLETLEEPCNCIMDTLRGEWSWIKKQGGFMGGETNNTFKSIVKILSQNNDGSINYEVFVEDTLFYRGSFQFLSVLWNYRKISIKLPHWYWNLDRDWYFYFGRLTEINEDLWCFWDGAMDGYFYYYQKIR